MEIVTIQNKTVGEEQKPYVIAEIGSNHNGDMALCKQIIDAAVTAGADAVKFQSWTPSSLVCKAEYDRNTSYSDTKKHFGSLEAMIKRYAFTEQQHVEIEAYCQEKSVTFLSSAFSPKEVDLLERLNVPAHKLASMDVNNFYLLEAIAETRKPIIVSTGMASLSEIEKTVEFLEKKKSGPIILLHCISIYPPRPETINLRNIEMLKKSFGKLVGFSDHSMGVSIPLAAIALGACMIEKHFTIDQDMEGWDHAISANPEELAVIVREGANVKKALGSYRRMVSEEEYEKRNKFRRSIVLSKSLHEGDRITLEDLDYKRPGNGISPDEVNYVVGRRVNKSVDVDHELAWEDLVS
ncbi:MAG: N-acetylneuraminate synthase family protein [Coxiellaceae bacterium]|nr:N-acetylneuraminate synthase family protein [Coxiellaceae bacterium]